MAEDGPGEVMQTRQPAWCSVGAAQLVVQGGGSTLAGEQLQQRAADPQDEPGEREPSGDRHTIGIGVSIINGRPHRECEHPVQEHGTGRAGDHGGISGGEAAKPLGEPPDPSRPHHRPHDRGPDQTGDQEPDAQGELDQREPDIQRCWVPRDEAGEEVGGGGYPDRFGPAPMVPALAERSRR